MDAFRVWLGGLLCMMCLASGVDVEAEMYRWKDAKGVTHFSDEPPQEDATTGKIRDVVTLEKPRKIVDAAVYEVAGAEDAWVNGLYVPVRPDAGGRARFRRESSGSRMECLLRMEPRGDAWGWVIDVAGEVRYESAQCSDGTPPGGLAPWVSVKNGNASSPLTVTEKVVSAYEGLYEHLYYRAVEEVPVDRYPWVKYDFKVTRGPVDAMVGYYTPEFKSLSCPGYAMASGLRIFVRTCDAASWEWYISLPGNEFLVSEKVAPGTYPDKVRRWRGYKDQKPCHVVILRVATRG